MVGRSCIGPLFCRKHCRQFALADFFMFRAREFVIFRPRGFVLPASLKADMLSARVVDPQLITLWIANPQGQVLLSFPLSLIMFRPLLCPLSSGICNPRGCNCGYAIRAGHKPAITPLWIANPQGQENPEGHEVIWSKIKSTRFLGNRIYPPSSI